MVAVASGVLATLGGAAPTGIVPVDWAYVATAGTVLSLAGGRSRRVSWLASSIITLWLVSGLISIAAALLAVALSVWSLLFLRRRWTGVVIGALLAWVLADLGNGAFHGSTALWAVLAAAPILWSAALRLPHGQLRVIAVAGSALVGAAVLATTVFGLSVLFAVGDVGAAIDRARTGFDEASSGDRTAAAASFDEASGAFANARRKVSGVWTLPARLVPVVGQHARAVQVVASEGVSLTETAADTALSIDIDAARLVDGGIDLEFIDELAPVLARVELAILRARLRVGEADSAWLVGPVAERLAELTDELDRAAPTAHSAALAAAESPSMLGGAGPVEWLVLLTTPAESRGLGGLVGNFVVVRADHGSFSIIDAGRNEDLNRRLVEVGAQLRGSGQYLDRWGGYTPERFFQDVTLSPDLPSVAVVAADLYEQAAGVTIEGVIVLDPFAIQAILALAGPVQAGDVRLTADTVVDFLLVDQYADFADDELSRVFALNALVTGTFDAFTSGSLPGPRGLSAAIGPIVAADRLGLWWAAGGGPTELLEAVGLDGRFPEPGGGDLFAVVQQNSGRNKIDVYLERTIDYAVTVTDGRAEAQVRIEFANRAPATGLPAAVIGNNDQGYATGTNVALISVHTVLDVVEIRVDGAVTPLTRVEAFGAKAVTFTVEISAASSATVEIEMVGRLDDLPVGAYRLTLPHQPLVNPDIVTVRAVVDGQSHELLDQFELTRDTTATTADR